jgi:hypothetical protein
MQIELDGPSLKFRYESSDIRDFAGERLLESHHIGDNEVAILTRLRNRRRLEEVVEREARTMPVFNPIMDNKVLGREIKRGSVVSETKLPRRMIEAR